MSIGRGDVYDAELPGAGTHPVVVVTRQVAIPVLSSITAVLVTSTIRGHAAEVQLGEEEGLAHECVANCDNVFTIAKNRLTRYRGSLGPDKVNGLNEALAIALDLD